MVNILDIDEYVTFRHNDLDNKFLDSKNKKTIMCFYNAKVVGDFSGGSNLFLLELPIILVLLPTRVMLKVDKYDRNKPLDLHLRQLFKDEHALTRVSTYPPPSIVYPVIQKIRFFEPPLGGFSGEQGIKRNCLYFILYLVNEPVIFILNYFFLNIRLNLKIF